jgi:uncharacterized membrane protein YphA (DoxX/SURF4 family)
LAGTRASRDRRHALGASGTGAVRFGTTALARSGPVRPATSTPEGQRLATWAATPTRILLGLVFGWFGYHELTDPRLWTGYVPVVPATSTATVILVLAHGMVLFVLAVALIVGVAPRVAGAIGVFLLVEIVVALAVRGINDIVVRDVGVLGLAVAVAASQSRAVLIR